MDHMKNVPDPNTTTSLPMGREANKTPSSTSLLCSVETKSTSITGYKITYATSSGESEDKLKSMAPKIKSTAAKSIYKSNGRRRTLAPIRFKPNNSLSSSSSSLPSSSSSSETSTKNVLDKDNLNDTCTQKDCTYVPSDSESKNSKKRSLDEATSYNPSSICRKENIAPVDKMLSTPKEPKDIFITNFASMSSISTHSGSSDFESKHDKTSMEVDDACRIDIHSTSNNHKNGDHYDERKSNNGTTTSSFLSSVYSPESSGYKTQTDDSKSTSTTLRRSKRIRSKRQKAIDVNLTDDHCKSSSSSSSRMNTSSSASSSSAASSSSSSASASVPSTNKKTRKLKKNKNCNNSQPSSTLQQSDSVTTHHNLSNVVLHKNEKEQHLSSNDADSIDLNAISIGFQHSLSVSAPSPPASFLTKQMTIRSIEMDDEDTMGLKYTAKVKTSIYLDDKDSKNTATAIKNRQGRRRSLRLSKQKFLSKEKANDESDCSQNDLEGGMKDVSNKINWKQDHLHLIHDDNGNDLEAPQLKSKTSRRKSLRSRKGVPPQRFCNDSVLLGTGAPTSRENLSTTKSCKNNLTNDEIVVNNDNKCNKHHCSNNNMECKQESVHIKSPETVTKMQNNQVEKKKTVKKRRRRSSLGLHAGGLISVTDIERVGREAIARKKRRDYKNLSNDIDNNSVGVHSNGDNNGHDVTPDPKPIPKLLALNYSQTNEVDKQNSIHKPMSLSLNNKSDQDLAQIEYTLQCAADLSDFDPTQEPLTDTLSVHSNEKLGKTANTLINKTDTLRELEYLPTADEINIKTNYFIRNVDIKEKVRDQYCQHYSHYCPVLLMVP